MTVQEDGGDLDAAPGGEAGTPVASPPRFVAIGKYVYDRDLNRSTMPLHAPVLLAHMLNNGEVRTQEYDWEVAR